MKKLLFAVLIITTALTGCGKKKSINEFEFEYVDEEPSAVSTDNNSQIAADGTIDSIVVSRYAKEDTLEITSEGSEPYNIEISYNIPSLRDSSEAADAINKEIQEKSMASIELAEAILDGSAEEVREPDYVGINYEAYLNGDIVSIIIELKSGYIDWTDYIVYNYNISTHEAVNNDEILEYAGVSKDEFISNAKKTFGKISLDCMDGFLTADEANADETAAVEETAETENEAVEVEAEVEAADDSEAEAAGNNDNGQYGIIADLIYAYSDTVNAKNITKDMPMYLDDEGKICAVCLVSVPAGAGHYYYTERVENISNDALFSKFTEYAQKCEVDDFEKRCMGLYEAEGLSGSIVKKISLSNMKSEDIYIGFDSDDVTVFTMQFNGVDYSDVYLGTIKLAGIDENGVAYEYELTEKNGEALATEAAEGEEDVELCHSGKFYLNSYNYYDAKADDYIDGATYKFIDGEDMLVSDGYNVDLRKSFG